MTVTLDHTIVDARDNLASARFLAGILGVRAPESPGHFTPVVTDNHVVLDFMTVGQVPLLTEGFCGIGPLDARAAVS